MRGKLSGFWLTQRLGCQSALFHAIFNAECSASTRITYLYYTACFLTAQQPANDAFHQDCCALIWHFVFPAQPQTNSTRNSIVTSPKGNVPSSALVYSSVSICPPVCLLHLESKECTGVWVKGRVGSVCCFGEQTVRNCFRVQNTSAIWWNMVVPVQTIPAKNLIKWSQQSIELELPEFC